MTFTPNPTLKNIDDITLVRDVKSNGDNNSMIELIQRHSPLCINLYKTYRNECFTSGSFDFQIADKDRIIYEAAVTFDESKQIKFSTWLAHNLRYRCLTHRQQIREELATQYPEDIIEDICPKPPKNSKILDQILTLLDNLPDKRIKKIFLLRYSENHGLKWREIAEIMGMSRTAVVNLHDAGKNILLTKYQEEISLK